MRSIAALLITVLFSVSTFAKASNYPKGPDAQLTPGQLCTSPTTYRYPEKIAYCERNVETHVKNDIIDTYDKTLGYSIRSYPRTTFKIDHYIPLCMGGANDRENLWPQHESVYSQTDPLEQEACEKMAQGKLKQADAVALIKRAKNNLTEVESVRDHVRSL